MYVSLHLPLSLSVHTNIYTCVCEIYTHLTFAGNDGLQTKVVGVFVTQFAQICLDAGHGYCTLERVLLFGRGMINTYRQ